MLPLKLVRSLVLGETINNHPLLLPKDRHHNHNDTCKNDSAKSKSKTPLLLFLPTRELVTDTYRLATIARDMGMDLYPTPSLSHIIFSYPSSSSPSSSSPSTPCPCPSSSPSSSSWSSTSLSSWSLPNDAVPLPFPSLSSSPISHLRFFVGLSKGLFKLVFLNCDSNESISEHSSSNWDCSTYSLFSRLTGDRIDSMDSFSRALAGMGWTLFKTKNYPSSNSGKMVYLFRKVNAKRVQGPHGNGECRVRELRLPTLDFRNAPLRILHYIILMTDDLFYLA